ncbi:MAG: hypothetical protein ACREDE_11000 [Thermoplasmata archaeon]
MTLDFSRALEGRCVVCGEAVASAGAFVCLACGRACGVDLRPAGPSHGTVFITDAKSRCCHADVRNAKRITCSERCHDAFVAGLERDFGREKTVVDGVTGRRYRVPTRLLIERGISTDELSRVPEAGPD